MAADGPPGDRELHRLDAGASGIEGLMDFVVERTVSKVLEGRQALQLDSDGIARTAAQMVKAELLAETQRVAAPAGAAAARNGAGPQRRVGRRIRLTPPQLLTCAFVVFKICRVRLERSTPAPT